VINSLKNHYKWSQKGLKNTEGRLKELFDRWSLSIDKNNKN
jgi:hypothetical protein